MDNKMLNESIRKAAKEAIEDALKMMANAPEAEPDPDPETVEMLEALEEEIGADDLLLMAMEGTCEGIYMVLDDTIQRPLDGIGICDAAARIRDLAEITLRMHDRLMVGKTLEKLRFMRGVEQTNDENIRKWSDEHEQGGSGPRGNQGEG